MIPAILFLVLRRYRKTNPAKAAQLALIFRTTCKFILLFVLFVLAGIIAFSQTNYLQYSIKRKGSQVGSISFYQQFVGNKKIFRTESEVKTRMIFLFTAIGREEAVYENGVLLSSSVYQKLNGEERLNKKTMLVGRNYVVYNGKRPETLTNYPISYNMICLFGIEPAAVRKVYSDKFQQFLEIQAVKDHQYRIKIPDGNFNEYFYKDGLCTRVEVHHSLYRSSFELKN
jgi:5-formaminoimidazole-4-carboxamide-1-beta-D-ribofuranosyl 5'-monophosphate synthetase